MRWSHSRVLRDRPNFAGVAQLALMTVMVFAGGCRSVPDHALVPDREAGEVPRLRPGMRIHVQVHVAEVLQSRADNVRVSHEGDIALPLVGTVQVKGMTLRQAESMLTEKYRVFYVDPVVRMDFVLDGVTDATSPWGYVTVLGQVKNPGRVNLPPTRDLTVTRAIQLAGGLSTSARQRAVRVTRYGPDGDKPEVLKVNLRKVGAPGARDEDLLLKDGDVVFVPETLF